MSEYEQQAKETCQKYGITMKVGEPVYDYPIFGENIKVEISGSKWQLNSPDGHYSWVATWESAI